MDIEIVIGLPGSGKSHLLEKFKEQGYEIYDDFISSFYDCKLISETGKMCIADPRLCDYNNFLHYIKFFANRKIHLTLFENEPSQCLTNIQTREANGDNRDITRDLNLFTKMYDLKNYMNYDHIVLPVYSFSLPSK